MNNELVKISETVDEIVRDLTPPVSLGAIACPHEQIIPRASKIATQLGDLIEKQKLYYPLRGQKYITVEGWTTLLAILGCGVRELNCECVEETESGQPTEWVGTVELFKLSDGSRIGGASSIVGRDENKWKDRHARRSMAVTRATSKACRLSFSWIIAMAGYAPTPAEEMMETGRTEPVLMPEFDPLVAEALIHSAKEICERQGSLDALEAWFRKLSRYAQQCIKREPYASQLDELKQTVLPEEKDEKDHE